MCYRSAHYCLKMYEFKKGAPCLELVPLYKGIGSGTCLNVLLEHEHYDTILSMPAVLGYPYYCDHCDEGYRNVQNHRTSCPYRCSLCLADTPCAPDGTFFHCSECKGFFRSIACYKRHLKPYSYQTNIPVCDLMDRCEQVIPR